MISDQSTETSKPSALGSSGESPMVVLTEAVEDVAASTGVGTLAKGKARRTMGSVWSSW
jgi:hypothetical protein